MDVCDFSPFKQLFGVFWVSYFLQKLALRIIEVGSAKTGPDLFIDLSGFRIISASLAVIFLLHLQNPKHNQNMAFAESVSHFLIEYTGFSKVLPTLALSPGPGPKITQAM